MRKFRASWLACFRNKWRWLAVLYLWGFGTTFKFCFVHAKSSVRHSHINRSQSAISVRESSFFIAAVFQHQLKCRSTFYLCFTSSHDFCCWWKRFGSQLETFHEELKAPQQLTCFY